MVMCKFPSLFGEGAGVGYIHLPVWGERPQAGAG